MENKGKLHKLEENNTLRKIYIKNETTPLVRKENDRLYTKLRNLKAEHPDNVFKIMKGKLMEGERIIDEFNINNSIF